jgi:dTMP kinase
MNGRMIVIDGMDGAGKGTQTRLLVAKLQQAGKQTLLTREPGGSPGAEEIRQLVTTGSPDRWDATTELLLMYAARRSHLVEAIWPAMRNGRWVVCDRFADSSRCFQGIAGGLGLEVVDQVHNLVVGSFKPDLTIILDIPANVALDRAKSRGAGPDRFERKGLPFHQLVRQGFIDLAAADPAQHVLIDAQGSVDDVFAAISHAVHDRLGP